MVNKSTIFGSNKNAICIIFSIGVNVWTLNAYKIVVVMAFSLKSVSCTKGIIYDTLIITVIKFISSLLIGIMNSSWDVGGTGTEMAPDLTALRKLIIANVESNPGLADGNVNCWRQNCMVFFSAPHCSYFQHFVSRLRVHVQYYCSGSV